MITWYQYFVGLSLPIIETHPFPVSDIKKHTWMNNFVRLLIKYRVEIKFKKPHPYPPTRQLSIPYK